MYFKATAGTLAFFAMAITPALAEAQMGSGNASMSSSNAMMASGDHTMKPMSKSEMAMMTKCKKMSPSMMQKNKKCTKMMAMHPDM